MAKFQRKNAWDHQGTFENSDLLWYAKGVEVMQSRSLDDDSSWWFFAAIHGEYISDTSFPGWGEIPGPPAVPTTPLPSQTIQGQFWKQCQHQTWYFAPWHRGYLIALEDQIRLIIIGLGGPSDWSLPYWNYFGPDDEFRIPPAFTEKTLPDGSPNPLYVYARFGINGDGNIYIDTSKVSEACQDNTVYTGSNAATPSPGYGGPLTGFSHRGDSTGNLEKNPHNPVHTQIGGSYEEIWGLMADSGIAALDPIFYLHHSNIDRMWAAWNAAGNKNPTDKNWLKGPTAVGERRFIMPMPNGKSWAYTPEDVNSLDQLDYDYDDLKLSDSPGFDDVLAMRLTKLGVQSNEILKEEIMDFGNNSELIGANQAPLKLKSSGVQTKVKFDNKAFKMTRKSLMEVAVNKLPDKVYLQIENVKGGMDANMLEISIHGNVIEHISLFGLRNASNKDGGHGGGGLTFTLDITHIIDDLHLKNALDIDSIDVNILPSNAIPSRHDITIGRISIYREQQNR